jgi:hypothetical protein
MKNDTITHKTNQIRKYRNLEREKKERGRFTLPSGEANSMAGGEGSALL